MNRTKRRQRNARTINDVALKAGVSPMTVSRVINGESVVRAQTREKVERAIAALDYSPSAAARSLAGGEETRIALLHSNPSASYLSEFLVDSVDQASRSGVDLVVEKWDGESAVDSWVKHLLRSRINGVILPPPLCDNQGMQRALTGAGILAVGVATGEASAEMSAVSIDDRAAALTMTRHLIALGHWQIGFIKGDPGLSASERRLEGYRHALKDAGIAADPALVTQGDFTYRSGLSAAERLLPLAERPSAIFASNDDMAAAAVAAAHRSGLEVPSDISVCGFDDTLLATAIWPELTTIRQPVSAMARAAVELPVKQIKGREGEAGGSPDRLLLDYELVRRQSDGRQLPLRRWRGPR
ncbi:LacI family DNA-binding transcriptional regulator [Sphingobium bisphenolivorans]|uniref:LacI family DNA-binding transcriptional regulator n=1 Tax=Sphingobium bisphenolivorans TaxID=1335760 RepID=UPI0003B611E3|nr:LacI family DNA-binding transcriptional regulator [Sphingobium bisphenolivorans]